MLRRYTLTFVGVLMFASVVCGQKVDPNKYALIINGPGGEPAYAKQFGEWTTQLSKVLADNLGLVIRT
jgi:hypothetical protein